jgi:transcriptional regulator with XRE-family HTH domain
MLQTRILRGLVGITQRELEEESGIRHASMVLYERGHAFPSRRQCKRIDDAMIRILERRYLTAVAEQHKERADPGPELPEGDADELAAD